jgi:hypothetical protein
VAIHHLDRGAGAVEILGADAIDALRFTAQSPEDINLQRVSVLKLVKEHMPEMFCERLAHIFMIGQEIPGGIEQVVEVQPARETLQRKPGETGLS